MRSTSKYMPFSYFIHNAVLDFEKIDNSNRQGLTQLHYQKMENGSCRGDGPSNKVFKILVKNGKRSIFVGVNSKTNFTGYAAQ